METSMSELLTHTSFARHSGELFQVTADTTAPVAVTLIEASPPHIGGGYESFALIFRGPRAAALQQGNYSFSHAAQGTFELFLVPIHQDAASRDYEVVFNRQITEPQP
jgi:hypothetical protein